MDILSRLLGKRGIKDVSELSTEEQETFNQWKKTLSEDTVDIDTIKGFCDYQLSLIDQGFKDLDRTPQKTERLVLLHNVYSSLKGIIDNPQVAKKSLVEYLTGML